MTNFPNAFEWVNLLYLLVLSCNFNPNPLCLSWTNQNFSNIYLHGAASGLAIAGWAQHRRS